MTRHHRWSFPYAPRGRIYSSFSRPFRSVYSPALTQVYIPFFWHGVSLPRTSKILNGSATTEFDPLYCVCVSVCAGCAMKKNLALHHCRGIVDKATTLLFHLSYQRPVSKISLVSFISHLLRLVGIDPSHYSGHSFRIGGATSTSLAGLTDYEIKLIGRWNYQWYLPSFSLQFFLDLPWKITQTRAMKFQYATPYMFNEPAGDH